MVNPLILVRIGLLEKVNISLPLKTKGQWFIDREGRSILLRGVNLGGSTKVPFPKGATHIKTDFSDHRDISFIGRPFPADNAQEHLERLKHWGFNCLRFLTTWEAIEHKGAGEYDSAYLDYLTSMVKIASDFGFYIFIDPHQDVWSRMSGGDGAPGWLFEKVGLDFTKFDTTDTALVMQYRYPEDYPPMCWITNSSRFATATMFTLFFGGNDFAPGCKIEGIPVQDYMQSHYINAIKQIALRCRDIDNVIGYDIFNEPGKGFIGYRDITRTEGLQPPGLRFTPFEAMVTASGIPRKIPIFEFKLFRLKKVGEKLVNPNGVSCWLSDHKDIWQEHGVWNIDRHGEPHPLETNYFRNRPNGDTLNFFRDYLRPFINRFTREIRSIVPETIIFIEGESRSPDLQWGSADALNVVNSSHWYDGITLMFKKFRSQLSFDVWGTKSIKPVFGSRGIKKMFRKQLGKIKETSDRIGSDGIPTLIGEFGLPYDLDNKKAFTTGDFSTHEKALTWYYEALDHFLLHATQWNYTADNNNKWGDQWNHEDFSIFSRDQQTNLSEMNSGGRAIKGFCRPYVQKTAGTTVKMEFKKNPNKFLFLYESDTSIHNPTEIYVPEVQYAHGYIVDVSGGEFTVEKSQQILKIFAKESIRYTVTIYPK